MREVAFPFLYEQFIAWLEAHRDNTFKYDAINTPIVRFLQENGYNVHLSVHSAIHGSDENGVYYMTMPCYLRICHVYLKEHYKKRARSFPGSLLLFLLTGLQSSLKSEEKLTVLGVDQ